MAENPALFVRVSTPEGHFTVSAASAERAGASWRVLKQDPFTKAGTPRPPKLRVDLVAATPTDSEANASDDSEE